MGGLANSAISILLGWVRSAAAWIWSIAGNQNSQSVLNWFGHSWVVFAILLCLIGVVVDGIVHFYRWRPDQVWQSYLRRIKNRDVVQAGTDKAEQRRFRRWVYADGSARVEAIEQNETSYAAENEMQIPQEAEEPVNEEDTEPIEETLQPTQRPRRADRHRQPRHQWLSRLQDDGVDEVTRLATYRPQTLPVDKNEAFNEPTYPTQWKNNQNPD